MREKVGLEIHKTTVVDPAVTTTSFVVFEKIQGYEHNDEYLCLVMYLKITTQKTSVAVFGPYIFSLILDQKQLRGTTKRKRKYIEGGPARKAVM